MNKKIRFAVIGCGHIGKRHAEMITRDEGGAGDRGLCGPFRPEYR